MKWTKEKCAEEALKYNSRSEFIKKSLGSYKAALRNKWLNEICNHMVILQNPRGYWSKEKCQEEALKYTTKVDFRNGCPTAYSKSKKCKWISEICSHMILLHKPNGYWTKERCQEEASKYKTRGEFQKNSESAYNISSQHGWLDEICIHLEKCGNYIKRCIYVYEFYDNSSYIGLTHNLNKRHNMHLSDTKSSVYLKIKQNISFNLKQLTDYIDVNEAKNKEEEYVNKYKKDNWIILNKAKTGGIGGGRIIWSKEKCIEESLKYKTKTEFRKNNEVAYVVSKKHNWLDEICSHMIETKWTKERCIKEALKYTTKKDFISKSFSAYKKALHENWLDEITSHLIGKISYKFWTKERCQEEALKYNNRSEFQKKSNGAYYISKKNNWLSDVCSHMIEIIKPSEYWTKERCHEEALKYNNKSDFRINSVVPYDKSKTNKWLDEICVHMK